MAQRRPAWTRRKSRRLGSRPGRAEGAAAAKLLGREFRAALAAAIGDNLAATNRCHPGPKAVPALAHQLTRLISAFHDATPSNTRPPREASGAKSVGEGNNSQPAASQRKR